MKIGFIKRHLKMAYFPLHESVFPDFERPVCWRQVNFRGAPGNFWVQIVEGRWHTFFLSGTPSCCNFWNPKQNPKQKGNWQKMKQPRQSSDIVNNNSAQTLNEILTPWQRKRNGRESHVLAFQEQICQITERQQKLLRNWLNGNTLHDEWFNSVPSHNMTKWAVLPAPPWILLQNSKWALGHRFEATKRKNGRLAFSKNSFHTKSDVKAALYQPITNTSKMLKHREGLRGKCKK